MKSRIPSAKPGSPGKAVAAEQIALEASRLTRLATDHEMGLLAHLIDMVVLEAWREATESESSLPEDSLAS